MTTHIDSAHARDSAACAELEVNLALSRTGPTIDLDGAGAHSAVAIAAIMVVAALLLLRIVLCRRAWGELPSARVAAMTRHGAKLFSNWRNIGMLVAVVADGFTLAAPTFVAAVPWHPWLPLKLVARASTLVGVRSFSVYIVIVGIVIFMVVALALCIALSNYAKGLGGCPSCCDTRRRSAAASAKGDSVLPIRSSHVGAGSTTARPPPLRASSLRQMANLSAPQTPKPNTGEGSNSNSNSNSGGAAGRGSGRRDTTSTLVSLTSLRAASRPVSALMAGSPHSAAAAADGDFTTESVSARDPRDGGFWQPRVQLGPQFAGVLYLLSTILLLPALVATMEVFTCVFPYAAVDGTSPCAGDCWSGTHIVMCVIAAIVLSLIVPIATVGFVTQQRLDSALGTAHVATHLQIVSRRVVAVAARWKLAAKNSDRALSVHSVPVQSPGRYSRANTPGGARSVAGTYAAGMASRSPVNLSRFSPKNSRTNLLIHDHDASEGSDGDAATFTFTPASPARSIGSQGGGGGGGRQGTMMQLALREAASVSPQHQRTLGAATTSTVGQGHHLQLQMTGRYVMGVVTAKVVLAASSVLVARLNTQGALILCAVTNALLLLDVWRHHAFGVGRLRLVPRITHAVATITSWLVLLNHVMLPPTASLVIGGAGAVDGAGASIAAASAANSDAAFAGHVTLVVTAGVWLVVVIAGIVAFVRLQRAAYGSARLLHAGPKRGSSSASSSSNSIVSDAAAGGAKVSAGPGSESWDGSFWRRAMNQDEAALRRHQRARAGLVGHSGEEDGDSVGSDDVHAVRVEADVLISPTRSSGSSSGSGSSTRSDESESTRSNLSSRDSRRHSQASAQPLRLADVDEEWMALRPGTVSTRGSSAAGGGRGAGTGGAGSDDGEPYCYSARDGSFPRAAASSGATGGGAGGDASPSGRASGNRLSRLENVRTDSDASYVSEPVPLEGVLHNAPTLIAVEEQAVAIVDCSSGRPTTERPASQHTEKTHDTLFSGSVRDVSAAPPRASLVQIEQEEADALGARQQQPGLQRPPRSGSRSTAPGRTVHSRSAARSYPNSPTTSSARSTGIGAPRRGAGPEQRHTRPPQSRASSQAGSRRQRRESPRQGSRVTGSVSSTTTGSSSPRARTAGGSGSGSGSGGESVTTRRLGRTRRRSARRSAASDGRVGVARARSPRSMVSAQTVPAQGAIGTVGAQPVSSSRSSRRLAPQSVDGVV